MLSSIQTGKIYCSFFKITALGAFVRNTREEVLMTLPPVTEVAMITHREAEELGDFLTELNHRTLTYILEMSNEDKNKTSKVRRALRDMNINFEQRLEDLPRCCLGEIIIAICIDNPPFISLPCAYVPLSAALNYNSNSNFKSTTDELLDFLRV